MSVHFHEGRQKTNEVNDYKVHYRDPDSHTCVSHKTVQTSGNWIRYLMNDTYLHKRKTIPYFMCYTKKQHPEDSSCYKRNLGIIEENRAYETQRVNKPLANILQLHCDPLYVRIKKSTF